MPWRVNECGRRGATGGVRGVFLSIGLVLGLLSCAEQGGRQCHIGFREADCQICRACTRAARLPHPRVSAFALIREELRLCAPERWPTWPMIRGSSFGA